MKNAMWKQTTGVIGVLACLGILVAVNYLLAGVRLRKDLTAERLFTLSASTRQLLAGLPRDVTLKFYFSQSIEDLPIPLKQYAQRVKDLLREYAQLSRGRITLETYDPRPDSTEEEWAERYGLSGQPLAMLGGGPVLYLGLVAVSGAKESVLPMLSPDNEPQLEYLVTRLVYEVTQARRPKIGVLSSLPVMGAPDMMSMRRGRPWALVNELQKQYTVVAVPPDSRELPADLDLLLVIHPRQLGDGTLFALDQFVLRGGRLLAFLDPLSLAQRESGLSAYEDAGSERSDLNRLTHAWGFDMDPGRMVADPVTASKIQSRNGTVQRMPAWLSLRDTGISHRDLATSPLRLLMLPFAGAFTGAPPQGVTAEPLLTTSPEAGLVAAADTGLPLDDGPDPASVSGRPLTLALRLHGTFPTAFPNGRPPGPGEPTNAPPPGPPPPPPLKVGTQPGTVVLVGDADLLYDRFCIEQQNFFGASIAQLANDNLPLALNLAEQLSGSEALISLRSRGRYERPFDRVLALETAAAKRWKEEERKLTDALRETQARLAELEQTKTTGQSFILSPEQKQALEKFRREQFQIQRQLKDVRKKLREDIEALGLRLKIVNIAAVPLLVAAFGIARGTLRKRRS